MKTTQTLIVGSLAAAALALGLETASAQSGLPQSTLQGTVTVPSLTPEQREAVRAAIKDRLADEFRDRIGERLSDAAAVLNSLTPEHRAFVRSTIRQRVAAEIREGLADRLADRLGDLRAGSGSGDLRATGSASDRIGDLRASGSAAIALTPEQRAAVRGVIRQKLADEMRDRVGDDL